MKMKREVFLIAIIIILTVALIAQYIPSATVTSSDGFPKDVKKYKSSGRKHESTAPAFPEYFNYYWNLPGHPRMQKG